MNSNFLDANLSSFISWSLSRFQVFQAYLLGGGVIGMNLESCGEVLLSSTNGLLAQYPLKLMQLLSLVYVRDIALTYENYLGMKEQ